MTGAGLVAGACGGGGSSANDAGVDMAAPGDLTVTKDLVDPTCPMSGKANVGPASAFAVGDVKLFLCAQLFVIRDAKGIYAMTGLCTHNQCLIDYAPATNDFGCPCHGSTFDINGNVTSPPAPMPLSHYTCSLDVNGDVVVDLNSTNVDPTTRLAV